MQTSQLSKLFSISLLLLVSSIPAFAVDKVINGGTGADILAGGPGADTFIIRAGDGGLSIGDADIIYDFTDGTDIIGMSGLNFSDLKREQGTGSYSNHVVVKKLSSGEFLIIIENVSLSSVDDNDFSAI